MNNEQTDSALKCRACKRDTAFEIWMLAHPHVDLVHFCTCGHAAKISYDKHNGLVVIPHLKTP